jgi:ligand-binding SRPBCC domain-containing protein
LWSEQSIATVNYELGPWIQMSAPAKWQSLALKDWCGNGPLFKSWVLLLGIIPLDHHAFGSLDLSQDMRFVETSSSWVNCVWQHERVVKAVPGGCEVIDKISFAPRLSFVSAMLKLIYVLVFRHRHAKLRLRYTTSGDHFMDKA